MAKKAAVQRRKHRLARMMRREEDRRTERVIELIGFVRRFLWRDCVESMERVRRKEEAKRTQRR